MAFMMPSQYGYLTDHQWMVMESSVIIPQPIFDDATAIIDLCDNHILRGRRCITNRCKMVNKTKQQLLQWLDTLPLVGNDTYNNMPSILCND